MCEEKDCLLKRVSHTTDRKIRHGVAQSWPVCQSGAQFSSLSIRVVHWIILSRVWKTHLFFLSCWLWGTLYIYRMAMTFLEHLKLLEAFWGLKNAQRNRFFFSFSRKKAIRNNDMSVDCRAGLFLREIAFGLCPQWKRLHWAWNAGHSALEK